MTLRRITSRAAAAATIVVLLLALAHRLGGLPEGLRGSYYPTTDWTQGPVHMSVDPQPSTANVEAAWDHHPAEVFSAIWRGSVLVLRSGTYRFATTSDDGSWTSIDGQLCIDIGGRHAPVTGSCSVILARGVHAIEIKYFQGGGPFTLQVAWGRDDEPVVAIPSSRLAPRAVSFEAFAGSFLVSRALMIMRWIWAVTIATWLGALVWPLVANACGIGRSDPIRRGLALVIGLSLLLNAIGIWCGLSAHAGWLGDELIPTEIRYAASQHFSNGWWAWYPPVHFATLWAAYSPVLLLEWLGLIDASRGVWYDVLHLINRLVSLAQGVGILIAVYLTASTVFSRRAGVFAAASLAVVVPFVAYTKVGNIEIPYLFWFAVSMVFYVRFLYTPTLRDAVLFATAGALAICTKDQAYGLFLGAPLVLGYAMWREPEASGQAWALGHTLVDRRMLAAAIAFTAVFVAGNNLVFNFDGFTSREAFLMNGARMVKDFNLFDAMPARRLQVLVSTVALDVRSLGWPLLLVSTAGWVSALASVSSRRAAAALTVVAATYYLGFINVVMYCYDRFLLPVCLVQALFAGVCFDRWLASPRLGLLWRRAPVAAILGYSLLYAGMYDALLMRDSRYAVEAWLREQALPGAAIGSVFDVRLRPNLDGFTVQDIATIDELTEHTPAFYVFDADYARAVRPGSPMGQMLAGLRNGSLGYELALEYRAPAPWGWLPGAHPDLIGPRVGPSTSSLRDVNPTFQVYRRRAGPPAHAT